MASIRAEVTGWNDFFMRGRSWQIIPFLGGNLSPKNLFDFAQHHPKLWH
jgi:hypothetical protein